jgi:hypothetical protein
LHAALERADAQLKEGRIVAGEEVIARLRRTAG